MHLLANFLGHPSGACLSFCFRPSSKTSIATLPSERMKVMASAARAANRAQSSSRISQWTPSKIAAPSKDAYHAQMGQRFAMPLQWRWCPVTRPESKVQKSFLPFVPQRFWPLIASKIRREACGFCDCVNRGRMVELSNLSRSFHCPNQLACRGGAVSSNVLTLMCAGGAITPTDKKSCEPFSPGTWNIPGETTTFQSSRLGIVEMISNPFNLWMFGVPGTCWTCSLEDPGPSPNIPDSHLSQVMKARAAANVPRAAPGPTATCLFASDVCLGIGVGRLPDAGAEFRCQKCCSCGPMQVPWLSFAQGQVEWNGTALAGICAIGSPSTPIISLDLGVYVPLLYGLSTFKVKVGPTPIPRLLRLERPNGTYHPSFWLFQAEGLLRKVKDVLVFLLSNTLLFVVSAVSRNEESRVIDVRLWSPAPCLTEAGVINAQGRNKNSSLSSHWDAPSTAYWGLL